MSMGAGLILGALAMYFPRLHPVAPVPIAASASQPAPPPIVATTLVPLESVRVSIARQSLPKSKSRSTVPSELPVAQATRRVRKLTRDMLCVNSSGHRECQAAFAAALRSADLPAAVETTAEAREPLRFQKGAAWMRRLETIGKEGIPFMRVPRGPENELVVGIDRKGMLGFSLRQDSDRER